MKRPNAILQRREMFLPPKTKPQIIPVKYCACPQALIVLLGTNVVDWERGTHYFCITSTFQGKNNKREKRIGKTVAILILLIKRCPQLSQIKSKDVSSKLYSKIIRVQSSRAVTLLEFY